MCCQLQHHVQLCSPQRRGTASHPDLKVRKSLIAAQLADPATDAGPAGRRFSRLATAAPGTGSTAAAHAGAGDAPCNAGCVTIWH